MSYDKSVSNHQMLSRDKTLNRLTGLNPQGLKGAAKYYDGQVELAECLCVENTPEFEGLLSVIGGKLSTCRALAEHAVDAVYKKLGQKSPKCSAAHIALPGENTSDFTAFG